MLIIIIVIIQFFIINENILLTKSAECQICIGDHICSDDTIYFNTFVSEACHSPLATRFSFDTDVTPDRTYFNVTFSCVNCYTNVTIDAVKDAWDYTLYLESPIYQDSSNCSIKKVARCGGTASKIVLYTAAGISALFILFGALVCAVKTYRSRRRETLERKNVVPAVIN